MQGSKANATLFSRYLRLISFGVVITRIVDRVCCDLDSAGSPGAAQLSRRLHDQI